VAPRPVEELDSVVIRFVGDSGDGMQLTGNEFSKAIAKAGHDFATHPDYPSEIRAPTGTLFGVSGYQIQFASRQVFTSGDAPDVLVAMNPAALKTNLSDVKHGGIIIANSGAFTDANLAKAGYKANPLDDGSLGDYRLYKIDISELTAHALKESGLSKKEIGRCKNYYALGLMLSLYSRPLEKEEEDIRKKFAKKPEIAEANVLALRAGYAYADATEMFITSYRVRTADIAPGTYRSLTGNHAAALGFVAASELDGVPLFLGSYPITPATDILHELSALKHYNVTTFQAEDEIAGICSAIGAAYGGVLGMTTTSGPGMALKTEALGLAVMLEIAAGDRKRPARRPVHRPADQDRAVRPAAGGVRPQRRVPDPGHRRPFPGRLLRLRHRGLPPGREVHDAGDLPLRRRHRQRRRALAHPRPGLAAQAGSQVPHRSRGLPGLRPRRQPGPRLGAPRHAGHGTPRRRPGEGLPHRQHLARPGEPPAHGRGARRQGRGHRQGHPAAHGGRPAQGDLLIVGWGSTYGSIVQAREQAAAQGLSVAHVHLRHLNPLPPDLGDILRRYKRVLVPEMNLGQLSRLLRERFLIEVEQLNKVQGKPFKVSEIHDRIVELCKKGAK
jgi:2-oxoglutarate ferredoxin oxidoreductase subunit alpha